MSGWLLLIVVFVGIEEIIRHLRKAQKTRDAIVATERDSNDMLRELLILEQAKWQRNR